MSKINKKYLKSIKNAQNWAKHMCNHTSMHTYTPHAYTFVSPGLLQRPRPGLPACACMGLDQAALGLGPLREAWAQA